MQKFKCDKVGKIGTTKKKQVIIKTWLHNFV